MSRSPRTPEPAVPIPVRATRIARAAATVAAILAAAIAPAVVPPAQAQTPTNLRLVSVALDADDGDGDGFADTNETVSMRLRVLNTGAADVDVVLELRQPSAEVACIGRSGVPISIPAGQAIWSEPFRFTVGGIDRATAGLGPLDRLRASFELHVRQATLPEVSISPAQLDLELDLDVSGGTGPTTFHEGFESGDFGAFEVDNMDADLDSLEAADGYRCQYMDPDGPNPNNLGVTAANCFPGLTDLHSDAIWWHVDGSTNPDSQAVDGGRAFEGSHSLYYGAFLNPADGHSTPLATLEAVATTDPVHIGWGRVCATTRTQTCDDDLDCPPGESCVLAQPALTFKHQISLMDDRVIGVYSGTTDRGVVMAQLADAAGDPVGPWFRLEPTVSPYETNIDDDYNSVCMFDPIDDGSTEDDYFDPLDPDRRLGPSSTCEGGGNRVYSHQGRTVSAFDPGAVGEGDAPGLAGSLGSGTWVEPRIDLRNYRGASLRFRFLTTAARPNLSGPTWYVYLTFPGEPEDDGWWIDDVRVDDVLASPATRTPDGADNTFLPGLLDGDLDGVIDGCDNCAATGAPTQDDRDFDGIGDLCDNCPDLVNVDQDDFDSDGIGDPCDRCPAGDGEDDDGDGVACVADNCTGLSNPAQLDADGDGDGDVCDACPFDPFNDIDGDAVCGDVDSCDLRPNPDQGPLLKTSPPLAIGGDAGLWGIDPGSGSYAVVQAEVEFIDHDTWYAVPTRRGPPVELIREDPDEPELQVDAIVPAPDGQTLIAFAAIDMPGREEPYAIDPRTGARTRLDDGTSPFSGSEGWIDSWKFSPDGEWLVLRARYPVTPELYALPTAGGTLTRVNDPLDAGEVVTQFEFDAAGTRLVYAVDGPDGGSVRTVLWPGGAETVLAPEGAAQNTFPQFALTPDGATVIFLEWSPQAGGFELFSVPTGGGAVELLSGDLTMVDRDMFRVSPTGGHVAFLATDPLEVGQEQALYTVALSGGAIVELTDNDEDLEAVAEFSPDGSRVIYAGDKDVPGLPELYSVPVGGGPTRKLSTPSFPAGADGVVRFHLLSGTQILYFADETDAGVVEPIRVGIAGGPRTVLADLAMGERAVPYGATAISPDGSVLLYGVLSEAQDTLEARSVPVAGGASTVLTPSLPAGARALSPIWDPAGENAWFGGDLEVDGRFEVWAYGFDPDPDGDGIHAFCDTCPDDADPAQIDNDGDNAGAACDCDDFDPLRFPGGVEVCDGVDSDCDLDLPADEADADGDGWVECSNYVGATGGGTLGGGDCDDASAAVAPGAPEIADGVDNQCPGDAGYGLVDEVTGPLLFADPAGPAPLSWPAQAGATGWEVARSADRTFATGCGTFATAAPEFDDGATPAAGETWFYLVRIAAPAAGSWGADSAGVERVPVCP